MRLSAGVSYAGEATAAGLALALAWLPRPLWRPAVDAFFGIARLVRHKPERWRRRIVRKWLRPLPALRAQRPGGWRVSIRLTGREQIAAALAPGRGAILWVSLDADAPNMVSKMALAGAGFQVSHLSRPNHGFGGSPFQRRYLNPLVTRAESRFLAERIVISGAAPLAAMRTLRARLTANHLVSIIAFSGEAKREVEVTVEGQSFRFPSGPVTLASQSGASLLPIFCVERKPGKFEVLVEPPLPVAPRASGAADTRPYEEFARLTLRYRAERRRK